MTDSDTIKAEIKKVSLMALKAKMDLHDLSEELPVNWETIPHVAKVAFDSYKSLEALRAALKECSA
ncbi:MAG: CCE_0567 family metalloprotein [Fibrobacterota bacterium]